MHHLQQQKNIESKSLVRQIYIGLAIRAFAETSQENTCAGDANLLKRDSNENVFL